MATPDLLRSLAETDVNTPLPPDQLLAALQSPPFIHIPGTFNARDLGLTDNSSNPLRPGFAFRSGGFFAGLPDEGKAVVKEKLGIKRVFDLRSLREHTAQPDPEVEGVVNVWSPPGELDAVVDLEEFVEGEGERGYVTMYLDVLRVYRPSVRDVLEHVRDRKGEPFLFHCTAGRDRTGVVAGMLLALAGAEPEAVALDFLLSRIGTEPAREQLLAFALKGSRADNMTAPGFHNLANLKEVCWKAFIRALESEYGGWDGYVTKTLGFSDEDLVVIKRNLVEG